MKAFVLPIGGGGSSRIKELDQNSEETAYIVYSFSEVVTFSHTRLFYKGVVRRDALHI